MTCHFIIYNVKLGQCIGVLPHDQSDYAMMVDCGHEDDFHPIADFGGYLPKTGKGKPSLRTLTLTNYDHDHFSGLPNLRKSAEIKSCYLPKNLSMDELRKMKNDDTEALDALADLRDTYCGGASDYAPPFTLALFALEQSELAKEKIPIETNHLSQMIFLQYGESTICIPGDLENRSWELMLAKPEVQSWLRKTTILIAPHHGRENGYHEGIFKYCKPGCVIFSDKGIMHDTQKNMTELYAGHVRGDGVTYTPASGKAVPRKTLTTRNDGHILISIPKVGAPTFKAHA